MSILWVTCVLSLPVGPVALVQVKPDLLETIGYELAESDSEFEAAESQICNRRALDQYDLALSDL